MHVVLLLMLLLLRDELSVRRVRRNEKALTERAVVDRIWIFIELIKVNVRMWAHMSGEKKRKKNLCDSKSHKCNRVSLCLIIIFCYHRTAYTDNGLSLYSGRWSCNAYHRIELSHSFFSLCEYVRVCFSSLYIFRSFVFFGILGHKLKFLIFFYKIHKHTHERERGKKKNVYFVGAVSCMHSDLDIYALRSMVLVCIYIPYILPFIWFAINPSMNMNLRIPKEVDIRMNYSFIYTHLLLLVLV